MAIVLIGAFLLVVGLSVIFDLAYDRAMQQKDARQAASGRSPKVHWGVAGEDRYLAFWILFLHLDAGCEATEKRESTFSTGPRANADFFLLGFSSQIDPAVMDVNYHGG